MKEKNPSRVSVIVVCVGLMAYGVIFQTPLSAFLFVLLSYLQVPFYKVSSYSITAWDWGEHGKGRAQVWTGF
jgi:hypothetical protein